MYSFWLWQPALNDYPRNTLSYLFPRQQLYEGYLEIYKEFYSIKNIIKRLPNDRHQRVPYLLFNFFYRKFGKIVSKIAIFGLMNYLGKLAGKLSYGID